MIFLIAIALLATTAALIWLLVWLFDRGRVQRVRTLLLLTLLSCVPGAAALILIGLRHLVLTEN